jgi:hypothetical protein
VYVDALRDHGDSIRGRAARYGRLWSHLFADDEDELHAFAAELGLKRAWAQHAGEAKSHYDIRPPMRARAVELGAIEIDRRAVAQLLKARRTEEVKRVTPVRERFMGHSV